jgi:ABC-type branched-subunit amino acid transport system ATPase component
MNQPDLDLTGVTVHFGGLTALNDVSLHARGGAITGLIGPNGAGKTTTFNACAGVVSTTAGLIVLGGVRLDGHGTAHRAQAGLGRTFQRVELVETLSVRENIALGAEALTAGRRFWGQLIGSPRTRAQILVRADQEIARCGLTRVSRSPVKELSTGQRRLVELARVLVADYRFLLLDEPSSGLDKSETEYFGEIVAEAVTQKGTGVLLVEHDMSLIRQLCSYIYVLDFGEMIYDGEPSDVFSASTVRDAYLGTEQVA